MQFSYTVEIVGHLGMDSFQLPPVQVCHPCISDEKKKRSSKSYSGHSGTLSVGFAAPVILMCIMSRVGVNRQFTLLFHFFVSGPTPRRVITGKYIVKGSNFDVTHAHTSPHEGSVFRHLPIFKVWTISRALQTCRMSQTDSPQGQTLYLHLTL